MVDFGKIALILLAAGHSLRFGAQKMSAPLLGRPLAHHAAATLGALPFRARIAVTGTADLGLAEFGFEIVPLAGADRPMSASLKAGLQAARMHDAESVMIALADMPFVATAHVEALVSAFDGDRIGSTDGKTATPPAIFGSRRFSALSCLSGDKGARSLLGGAPLIAASAETLIDIDSPEQLLAAERLRYTG